MSDYDVWPVVLHVLAMSQLVFAAVAASLVDGGGTAALVVEAAGIMAGCVVVWSSFRLVGR